MLEGIRILDFTQLLPGPYATLRLSELGATVTKVEPLSGDPARLADSGSVFLANNRNKRSVALNLKSPADLQKAWNWAKTSDVVIEGFRPGVAQRLGIGYDTLKALNPSVVYCSLTGYGQTGPLCELAGHDVNYLAISGVLDQLRGADGTPIVPAIQFGDLVGGIVAVEAILAALVARGRTSQGRYLDVAMTDALVGLLTNHFLIEATSAYGHGIEMLAGRVLCYNLYATRDRRHVALGALEPKFWEAFCTAVDRPDWLPGQFSPAMPTSPVYRQAVELFARHDQDYWTALGVKANCCLTPVLTVAEVRTSAHVQARDLVFEMQTPDWGPLRQVATHAGGHPQKPSDRSAEPPPFDRFH